jgi:hypothetical protein
MLQIQSQICTLPICRCAYLGNFQEDCSNDNEMFVSFLSISPTCQGPTCQRWLRSRRQRSIPCDLNFHIPFLKLYLQVLLSICSLLTDPNPDDPLVPEIGPMCDPPPPSLSCIFLFWERISFNLCKRFLQPVITANQCLQPNPPLAIVESINE